MAIRKEHINGMEFRISGDRVFDKGLPNRAVLCIVFLYNTITDIRVIERGYVEVARTTTNAFGTYIFQRVWVPGDYIIKFYGTGKEKNLQVDTDWEFFNIDQKGIYDITPPDDTEVFQIIY